MPENALSQLYPPPPTQSQGGLLSGDPSKVLDLARGVNQLSLFPLQKQQLQQAVQGQAIQNITAQLEQDAKRTAIIANSYSAIDPKTATEKTIHDHTVFLSRQLTRAGMSTDGLIAAQEHVLSDPQGQRMGFNRCAISRLVRRA